MRWIIFFCFVFFMAFQVDGITPEDEEDRTKKNDGKIAAIGFWKNGHLSCKRNPLK